MKRIGFVGLGHMGMGMSINLIKAGYTVTGYARDPKKKEYFAAHGGQLAENNREVGAASNVVFIMVMNAAQAREVIFGENGLIEGMQPGSTVIMTASIGQSASVALENELAEYNIHYIDCAVSGGPVGANAGTLTIMESAPKQLLDDCEDLMNAVGKRIIRCGEKA